MLLGARRVRTEMYLGCISAISDTPQLSRIHLGYISSCEPRCIESLGLALPCPAGTRQDLTLRVRAGRGVVRVRR